MKKSIPIIWVLKNPYFYVVLGLLLTRYLILPQFGGILFPILKIIVGILTIVFIIIFLVNTKNYLKKE